MGQTGIATSDVRPRARGRTLVACAGVLVLGSTVAAQEGEWPYFGGDRTFRRYSPLDQIDASNVGDLRIVWRRPGLEAELREEFPGLRPGNNLRSTPIMVEGRLFLTNLVGPVRAVDPASGETLWSQAPFEPTIEEARGLSPRGVDLWTGGKQKRLFLARDNYLYSVDASNGELDGDFGDQGRVSLRLPGPLAGDFTWTAGPIVVGNVVVVAGFTGGAGDGGSKKEATPEDVRGYDVRGPPAVDVPRRAAAGRAGQRDLGRRLVGVLG